MANENEKWVGKKLIDKDNPKIQHTVIDHKDGTLILDNNGRVDEARVSQVFTEVKNDSVDVDSFFNSGSANALLTAIHNPNKTSVGIRENSAGVVQWQLGNGNVDPSTVPPPQNQQQPQPKQQNLNNHGLEPEGEVRKYYGNSMRDVVDEEEFEQHNVNYRKPNVVVNNPANNLFKNMRRTTPIKIKLILDEKIPKLDSIRHFNDLFDDPVSGSIIDQLAKEITDKYLADPKLLQDLVADHLDNLVYGNRRRKKKTSKTKKTSVKKTPTKRNSIVKAEKIEKSEKA